MARQPGGIASAENLRDWANYAKSNSVEYGPIKAQSKEDLAPCGTYGRENDYIVADEFSDWQEPVQKFEGRGWAKMSPTTADNTYTGKGGSKRD
jgi:hypothetical protein